MERDNSPSPPLTLLDTEEVKKQVTAGGSGLSLFQFSNQKWTKIKSNNISDVACGKDTWVLRVTQAGRQRAYVLVDGKARKALPGAGFVDIEADKAGDLYAIRNIGKTLGKIFKFSGGKWQSVRTGNFTELIRDVNGELYALSDINENNPDRLYKINEQRWIPGGGIKKATIGIDGTVYVIRDVNSEKDKAAVLQNNKWVNLPGNNIQDITVVNNQLFAIRNFPNVNRKIYRFDSQKKTWSHLPGDDIVSIHTNSNDQLVAIRNVRKTKNSYYIFNSGTNKWEKQPGSGFKSYCFMADGTVWAFK